jgi:hypothetical protein
MRSRAVFIIALVALCLQELPAESREQKTFSMPPHLVKVGSDKFRINYALILVGPRVTVASWTEERIRINDLPNGCGQPRPVDKVVLEVGKDSFKSKKGPIIGVKISIEDHPITSGDLADFLNGASIIVRDETGSVQSRSCEPVKPGEINRGLLYFVRDGDKPKAVAMVGLTMEAGDLFRLKKGKYEFVVKSGDVASAPLVLDLK